MLHNITVGLLVAAFVGAGMFNAIGTPAAQDDFARWGYPRWWCRITGGLEIVAAALIAFPTTRSAGIALGIMIIVAALVTVLRQRGFSHVAALGVFTAFLVIAATPS
jgi:hypothetical protein